MGGYVECVVSSWVYIGIKGRRRSGSDEGQLLGSIEGSLLSSMENVQVCSTHIDFTSNITLSLLSAMKMMHM